MTGHTKYTYDGELESDYEDMFESDVLTNSENLLGMDYESPGLLSGGYTTSDRGAN